MLISTFPPNNEFSYIKTDISWGNSKLILSQAVLKKIDITIAISCGFCNHL